MIAGVRVETERTLIKFGIEVGCCVLGLINVAQNKDH